MTRTALLTPILADQRQALCRAEAQAASERAQLEAAVVQVIREHGVSVDEASEASGLRPAEIYSILARTPVASGDLADLAGMR